jgi:hypothetical protein
MSDKNVSSQAELLSILSSKNGAEEDELNGSLENLFDFESSSNESSHDEEHVAEGQAIELPSLEIKIPADTQVVHEEDFSKSMMDTADLVLPPLNLDINKADDGKLTISKVLDMAKKAGMSDDQLLKLEEAHKAGLELEGCSHIVDCYKSSGFTSADAVSALAMAIMGGMKSKQSFAIAHNQSDLNKLIDQMHQSKTKSVDNNNNNNNGSGSNNNNSPQNNGFGVGKIFSGAGAAILNASKLLGSSYSAHTERAINNEYIKLVEKSHKLYEDARGAAKEVGKSPVGIAAKKLKGTNMSEKDIFDMVDMHVKSGDSKNAIDNFQKNLKAIEKNSQRLLELAHKSGDPELVEKTQLAISKGLDELKKDTSEHLEHVHNGKSHLSKMIDSLSERINEICAKFISDLKKSIGLNKAETSTLSAT